MKRITLFLISIVLLNCYNQYEHRDHKRTKKARDLTTISIILNSCKYGSSNQLFADSYYPRYSADTKQYETIIGGDSTEDLSCNTFSGYISKTSTQCVPVSGNTLKNMQEQTCTINTISPLQVIYGTAGGNDLLRGSDNTTIIQDGKNLIDTLNKKFPSAGKLIILVHPTQNTSANKNRGTTNSGIKSYAESVGWKTINPDSCFTIDASGAASSSNMIDSIHYNSGVGLCIKGLIQSSYNITF